MHPVISQLPSTVFYQNRLKDGPKMDEKTNQPWHKNPHFGVYRFFNVSRGLEESSGRSVKNVEECQIAVALYNRLKLQYTKINLDFRVGVVSMYRAQITELKRQFEQRFGKEILGCVDFNTVDGFQGQEKDVIILSCVRAGPRIDRIGFLSGKINRHCHRSAYRVIYRHPTNECCFDSSQVFSLYLGKFSHFGKE